MERDGVIDGIHAAAWQPATARRVTAIVMVYRVDRMRGGGVVTELARIPEVARCDILSGEFDLLVTVVGRFDGPRR